MQKESSKNFSFIVIAFSCVFTSCSLKYSETVDATKIVPEFSFESASLIRYEEKDVSVRMDVDALEQYKDSSTSYASGIAFTAFDANGQITTEGKCDYLVLDSDKKNYELYGNIELLNHEENTNFYAQALKWDEKTEQLTSSRNDTVKVEKDDTIIYGSGFSASGISKTFEFTGSVSGDILTSESQEDNQ